MKVNGHGKLYDTVVLFSSVNQHCKDYMSFKNYILDLSSSQTQFCATWNSQVSESLAVWFLHGGYVVLMKIMGYLMLY